MTTTQVAGIQTSGAELKTEIDREGRANPSIFKAMVTALLLIVTALSLFLFRITQPKKLYFDEAIYVGLARKVLAGNLGPMPEQFSEASVGRQHPPMGAYLIEAGIKFAGDNPLGWRVASAVAGALTLAAVFLWIYVLLGDFRLALSAAALTLFNNFLYVMSRIAMLDVFVFMFCIWGVLAFTVAVKMEMSKMSRRALVVIAGLLLGLAGACKWNAIDTLAGVWAITLLGGTPLEETHAPGRNGCLFLCGQFSAMGGYTSQSAELLLVLFGCNVPWACFGDRAEPSDAEETIRHSAKPDPPGRDLRGLPVLLSTNGQP